MDQKKKCCKSSLKNNQISLYFIDSLMVNLVICLPATLTHTCDLYPHPHPRPLPASRDLRHFDILVFKSLETFVNRFNYPTLMKCKV